MEILGRATGPRAAIHKLNVHGMIQGPICNAAVESAKYSSRESLLGEVAC